ncbi:hypothetical protein ACWCZ5_32885 [Streptomyces sp. NPDC001667]
MSGRHARDDAIDTTHPTRAVLALLAVAVGVPAAVVLHGHGGALLDESGADPAPTAMSDSASS